MFVGSVVSCIANQSAPRSKFFGIAYTHKQLEERADTLFNKELAAIEARQAAQKSLFGRVAPPAK